MRTQIILAMIFACLSIVAESKTVFRRTDKISENFKQLDLPAEEIDPNVAPPEPQKIETLDPEDVIAAPAVVEEANNAADEIIDESANEIIDNTSPVPHVAADEPVAGNAASSAPAASSSAVAAAPVAAPAATAADATTPVVATTTTTSLSKYCKCTENHCDCCRNFGLPLIPVRGPGCARISYLGKDEMSVSIKYGDITLASRRISSKKARPICVGLPGGYSKFCGRVYGLSRTKGNFKACLAFELRAEDEVEAALRVSCFKFGPEGLRVAEAEPLPAVPNKDQDEDDDDDDIFGFAAGGDDDEDEDADDYDDGDDDADTEDDDAETDTDDYEEDDDADAEPAEDADYGGFSIGGLLDELDDDDDDSKPASTTSTVPAAATAAVDQSRDVTPATTSDMPQSKDEAGTIAAAAESPATNVASVVQGIESSVTPVPDITSAASSPSSSDQQTNKDKPKKSKKAKKNKKKKAASATTESDFAFELLNGILDFFN